ncbi:MAG TPA: hypothetical protein VFK57_22075 [Vicinamibacterales bacterium]|nr:hypothetical protein [Vicinamibacterales bacterium]
MGWYRVRDGRVMFTGALTRDPYTAWIATRDGSAAIQAVAKTIGFRLFGRVRAARKRVWREMAAAAASEDGRAALQAAADLYVRSISTLAYAQALPRTTVELRRLVLVPRTLAAGRARTTAIPRLLQCRAFAERPAAEREFLFETALNEIDAAMRSAKPSIQRPVRAADEWVCVGADTRFAWVDQYWSGPGWSGHWFVYELPRQPLSRTSRKAFDRAVEQLNAGLATLSRERRQALVQLAVQ